MKARFDHFLVQVLFLFLFLPGPSFLFGVEVEDVISSNTIALHNYQNHFLSVKVFSTGKTTGHIAEISLNNTGEEEVEVRVGPYFIPSEENYQSYIVPYNKEVRIPPGTEVFFSIIGYCTDAFSQPVPSGKKMVDPSKWIMPDTKTIAENGFQPGLFSEEIPVSSKISMTDLAQIKESDPNDIVITNHLDFQIQNIIFGREKDKITKIDALDSAASPEIAILHLDPNRHFHLTANIYYDAILKILVEVAKISFSEWSKTPSLHPQESLSEAIAQHTLWIYTSFSVGKAYTEEDLRDQLENQFSQITGMKIQNSSDEIKREFEEGISFLWEKFCDLGEKARIFK